MLESKTRRAFRIDLVLLVLVLALASTGLLLLQSASSATGRNLFVTQLGWYVFGGSAATVLAVFDYRAVLRYAYVLYGFVVALLVLVLFVGVSRNNATRWLDLGIFEAQPSELAKVAGILVAARFLHDNPVPGAYRIRDLLFPVGLILVPVVLVAVEPDLGTALVILAIFGTIILFAGVQKRSLIVIALTMAALAAPMWFWGMKDYQRTRVTAFLDPEGLDHESAWQRRQSIIAIASGGFSGRGHGRGSQVQSGFVPESENDFIFAHLGEEFGFLGTTLMLSLYAALILWSLRIARHARDRFGVLLAVGIAAMFFWHVFINVGMVLGTLPVVGLWLPFASAGGSSILSIMICVGLLMNLSVRRHVFSGL